MKDERRGRRKRSETKRKGKTGSRRSANEKKIFPQAVGKVQMTREGYVFVRVEDMEDDIFVRPTKTKGALNGDTVRVSIVKEKTDRARMEGVVEEIVERSHKPFVGQLHIVGNQAWVLMQSKVMPYDITVNVLDAKGRPVRSSSSSAKADSAAFDGSLKQLQNVRGEFAVHHLYETVDGERVEMKAHQGVKVAVVVDGWDRGDSDPHGHIVDVLGEPGENDTEMHSILAEYSLPYRFEPEVEKAADEISDKITAKDLKGRKDFRDVLTFTIDPEDAKDFDDALSFRQLDNGNYEVGVHIADVSYYVTPGTAVDKEAQARGTSVYLVDRTVPMLPEQLSNKLCSLRPNEDKLTFSAVFELTPRGKMEKSWFGRTVIRSDYRFAYETAQQIIDNGESAMKMELRGGTDGIHAAVADPVLEASPEAAARRKSSNRDESMMGAGVYEGCVIPDELKRAVLTLHGLASVLRKRRFASGAISFERPEMKVEVDEKGVPVRVYQKISKEANWLIEEFMLLANRSVAEFIATAEKMNGRAAKAAKTFIYRIHDEPNTLKLEGVRNFAGNFGYNVEPMTNGKEASKELNALLKSAKDKPEFAALEMLALRSMSKACYSTDNIGHYGLAFKFYTHFTSPIRRYPDTMVHRLLAMYLDGEASQSKEYYTEQCKYASEREVIAAEAERASIKYKLVEYMRDKVGMEFEGHISGLTKWGMYVEIEPTKIEGMVALRDIKTDFFEFDEDAYKIVGKRTGKEYRLGDAVKIKVTTANLDQKILDYELVEAVEQEPVQGNKAARKAKVKKAIAASKKKSSGGSKSRKSGKTSKSGK